MSRQIEIKMELNLTVDFNHVKGTPERFSTSFGNWLPGESDEIIIESVMLTNGTLLLDIRQLLTKDELQTITDECFEHIKDD